MDGVAVLSITIADLTCTTLTNRNRRHSVWVRRYLRDGEIWCIQPVDERPGHSWRWEVEKLSL